MIFKVFSLFVLIFLSGCTAIKSPKIIQNSLPSSSALICKDDNSSLPLDEELLTQEMDNELPQYGKRVNDLEKFPQDISLYVNKNAINQEDIFDIQKQFEAQYYRPWSYTAAPICLKEASWPIGAFKGGYGSNLKPHDPSWLHEMELQSNFNAYSTINQPAITTKWMNLRVLPTIKPFYKNPARAGDGYPFDLLQNSSVSFNEPVFISHYSLDGAWVYIFTNNASGWVESNNIVSLSPEQIELLKSKDKLFITRDKVPLKNDNNHFVSYSRIGMVLSYSGETDNEYQVLSVDSSGKIIKLLVPKESSHIGIQFINKEELTKLGSDLLHNTYGWGGMFEERDCSSMIRDYLIPFGIFLPRNSAQQAKKGEVISFKDLNNTEKIELIKDKAIPFETILYKKGHVLLYIGTYDDNVMVMHNIWGIRTKDKEGVKGRVVIGKAVISTLELGSEVENFDPNGMLLTTLSSMNIFTKPPALVVQKKREKRLTKL